MKTLKELLSLKERKKKREHFREVQANEKEIRSRKKNKVKNRIQKASRKKNR